MITEQQAIDAYAGVLSLDRVPCPECRGRGYFWSDGGPAPRRDDCDWCDGSGTVFEDVEI